MLSPQRDMGFELAYDSIEKDESSARTLTSSCTYVWCMVSWVAARSMIQTTNGDYRPRKPSGSLTIGQAVS